MFNSALIYELAVIKDICRTAAFCDRQGLSGVP